MPSTAKGKIASCQTVKDRGLPLPKILPPGTAVRFRVTFKCTIDFHYCDLSEKLEGAPTHTHSFQYHCFFCYWGERLSRATNRPDVPCCSLLVDKKADAVSAPLLPPARPHLLTFPELPRVMLQLKPNQWEVRWSFHCPSAGGPSSLAGSGSICHFIQVKIQVVLHHLGS